LRIRAPRPADRARFVELFSDDEFMIFSGGSLDAAAAGRRFDAMLERCREVSFAKQPVIERSSGMIVGYIGVDWMYVSGRRRLEFGYRLVPAARGHGYATEAGRALLDYVEGAFDGELVVVIDPANTASIRTSRALGFDYWRYALVDGDRRYIGRLYVGPKHPPAVSTGL
jgi:RimJ/RimL family protein N-acetyltransferase